jgi:hypothetical protein
MKWTRALHHLEQLATACADLATRPATIFPLRVTELWTFGEILDSRDDVSVLPVVLGVDKPVDDVPWMCPPPGAEHWSNATRLSTSPALAMWRSTRAPLWNHHIRRPLLIWAESHGEESGVGLDGLSGVATEGLSALRSGTAEALRLPEPSPDELTSRLEAELVVSRRALESATAAYEQRRFGAGKLEPTADALWRAGAGYLDVLRSAESPPHHL